MSNGIGHIIENVVNALDLRLHATVHFLKKARALSGDSLHSLKELGRLSHGDRTRKFC